MPDQPMPTTSLSDALEELAKLGRDGELGYRTAAGDAKDHDLQQLFNDLAKERGDIADELESHIRKYGGKVPQKGGTMAGQAHRMFVDLKSAISGGNRRAILNEVVRGESLSEAAYDGMKRMDLPADLRPVIMKQHDRVKEARDRVRAQARAAGSSWSDMADWNAWQNTITESGRRAGETVQSYVSERPMTSTMVALGVGFIIGALLLIKREVLETVGLLPEEYFFGVEDLDYSLTVQRRGYKLYYVPQFIAYHLGGGSQTTWNPAYVYNSYRGKLILLEKHLPRGTFRSWKLLLTIYARFIAGHRWRRLAKKYGYNRDGKVGYEEMEFAVLQAIADHNKDALSEATLLHFDELLKQIRRKPR